MMSSFGWTKRLLVCGLCVAGTWFSSDAQAQQATTETVSSPMLVTGQKTTLLTNAAKQIACIDPETGRLVSPELRPECMAAVEEALAKERENGLIEESAEELKEGRLPDGGTKIDLKGRFKQHDTTLPLSPAPPRGGQIAFIDPQTGQLVTGEAAVRLRKREDLRVEIEKFDAELRAAMAASQDVSELREERLATGGVKLDLKGRFRNPLFAIVTPDRTVVVGHELPTSDKE